MDADADEAVDLGDGTADYSSSDEESDDGLHIVLNEDDGAPLPPPPPPPGACSEGYVAENEDGDDSGSRVKCLSGNNGSCGKVCILNFGGIGRLYILINGLLGDNKNFDRFS